MTGGRVSLRVETSWSSVRARHGIRESERRYREATMRLSTPSTAAWLALVWALTGASVTAFRYPNCVNGPLANNTVCNVNTTPSARAAALVKAMNISEKLVNLVEWV